MFKRLSILFIAVLFLSVLTQAFHFHSDGADHPECPVCVASHQQSDSGRIPVHSCEIQRAFTETVYAQPVSTLAGKTFFTPANSRAPPA